MITCPHVLATLACLEASLRCTVETIDALITSADNCLKEEYSEKLWELHADVCLFLAVIDEAKEAAASGGN